MGMAPKNGKQSKFPIARLSARFHEAKADPELLSMRFPLALLEARLHELLERIEAQDNPERWKETLSAWEKFTHYQHRGKMNQHELRAYDELAKHMEAAYDDYKSWEQVMDIVDSRAKLVSQEIKRLKEMRQFITAEDAYELVAKLFSAIMKSLQNHPKELKLIQHEFTRIIGDADNDIPGQLGVQPSEIKSSGVDTKEVFHTGTELAYGGEGSDKPGAVPGEVPGGGVK